MKVDIRHFQDVIIVDLEGRLVAGDGADVLHDVVDALLADSWKKIVLNLENVSTVDSTGAGELVESLKISQRFESSLRLLKPRQRVQKSLQIGQLLPLFQIYDDETKAIESFV